MFNTTIGTPVQQHVRAAFAASKAGDYRVAIREWTEVLRMHPESDGAYYYRAKAYESIEQLEKQSRI